MARVYNMVGHVAAENAEEMAAMVWIDIVIEYFDFSIAGMDFEPGAGAFWRAVEEEGVDLVWGI